MFPKAAFAPVVAIALTSCQAVVRPTISSADFIGPEPRVDAEVLLLVSEDFRTYRETSTDWMDFKKWVFEVGPCAVDAFRHALGSRFERVHMAAAEATDAVASARQEGVVAILRPEIVKLDGQEPLLFKWGEYSVDLACAIEVLDAQGGVLYERTYHTMGEQRGSVGFESAGHAAHPEAFREAMVQLARHASAELAEFLASAPEV
ncbi:MAG: hypothetical protein AAF682_02125 [Planctomycetota bacterium]